LVQRLLNGLNNIGSVTVHGPQTTANRTSVVSVTIEGYDPQELAAVLETAGGIQCRAGLHCAPRMHEALGTTAGGGTLRLSPGYSTSFEEIDAVTAAFAEMAVAATQRI
jgi:cysteine desulfurase/selenocysteine lyase